MKQKIHKMFEEKLTRINTAYNSINSNLPTWQESSAHDVHLCKIGLAYFKSGVPTPEEVKLKEQFRPREFAEAFQWFKMPAQNDFDFEKDFELRVAVRDFINQKHK